MNRWFLALTVATLTFPARAAEDEAEKLFRQAEKELLAAKTVRVEFDLKTGNADGGNQAKGTLVLGEGDKLRIDCAGSLGKVQFRAATRIGDGTKVHTFHSGEKPSTRDSPKGLGKALRGLAARPGILLEFDAIATTETSKVSDFKLGAGEKFGGIEVRIVEYTVSVQGRVEKGPDGRPLRMVSLYAGGPTIGFPVEGPVKVPAKVWIDTKTNFPAKLELRWAPAVAKGYREFTETLRFTVNGKLDEKLFEPPK
jgi:outer membrane lipoprotein-sorting protein